MKLRCQGGAFDGLVFTVPDDDSYLKEGRVWEVFRGDTEKNVYVERVQERTSDEMTLEEKR